MLQQQDSLNSSLSEATAPLSTPAAELAGNASMQPAALPCQQYHRLLTAADEETYQQPWLTKALLDQHEKAARPSLQQQSIAVKAPVENCTAAMGLEQMQPMSSQPSYDTSDTCSGTGSSGHPPPRRSAQRCKRALLGMMTPHTERVKKPSQPAPVYHPVTRQQDFPLSQDAACAMVQNLLQHPSASAHIPAQHAMQRQAASGRKRSLFDPDLTCSVRPYTPLTSSPCPVLPRAGLSRQAWDLPNEAGPTMWSVQVWPAPPDCVMG